MSLRVFTDKRCLEHQVPGGFPEQPERLQRMTAGLRAAGIPLEEAGEHSHTEEAVQAVHSADYIQRFRDAVAVGAKFLDTGDNPLSEGTWRAARAAVDVCLHTSDWVFGGADRKGIAAVRPPGHHAEHAMAMGFCYFNNVAVAAEYLMRWRGVERLAVVDFDVHHGNGTQHLFEDRDQILYVSTHQYPFYPGTGAAQETGKDAGMGATLNIPLPAGSGDEAYEEVFCKILLPTVRQYAPQAVLISAGFDAWRADPIGGMRVSEEAFRNWGRWLGQIADDVCEGRVLVTLEGGYDLEALADLVVAHSQGLADAKPVGG